MQISRVRPGPGPGHNIGRDPGASTGAANTDAACIVFREVTRGSGDKSTTQRLERGLERHKVFVRGYLFISGDRMQILIVPVTFGPPCAVSVPVS